jgi:hypothetical protein
LFIIQKVCIFADTNDTPRTRERQVPFRKNTLPHLLHDAPIEAHISARDDSHRSDSSDMLRHRKQKSPTLPTY